MAEVIKKTVPKKRKAMSYDIKKEHITKLLQFVKEMEKQENEKWVENL